MKQNNRYCIDSVKVNRKAVSQLKYTMKLKPCILLNLFLNFSKFETLFSYILSYKKGTRVDEFYITFFVSNGKK